MSAWSGTPAGLCHALDELSVQTAAVSVAAPRVVDLAAKGLLVATRLHRTWQGGARETVRHARATARHSRHLARIYTWTAHRRLARAGRLDGVLQIWAAYELPPVDARVVTFGDLTLPQALELGYPEIRALSKRDVERRMAVQRRCFERAFACCTPTRWAARSIVDDYGIDPEKVHAVGLGRNHTVRVVDRDWSKPRFLFIGTNWSRKNGDAVLSSFLRLRREIPAAELHLVGDHPRVEADGVVCHGALRLDRPSERIRLEQLFAASTCFVLPSRHEASAIAYLEAGAAGLPCIGTSVGGSSEFIGDAGRVVHPGDEASLFAAMIDLTDPATAARLGKLALPRAPLFTWRAVAERLLRAFELPGVTVTGFADFL